MTRIERRVLMRTVQLGLLLTLVVILIDLLGLLAPLELALYDVRARYFQFFTPPPSDRIVQIDIDDDSISQIDFFPFPRTYMAEMIDEIRLAGAKAIGLDIIYPDVSPTRSERLNDGTLREINDDRNFAAAIARAGNVLVPVSLPLQEERKVTLAEQITDLLSADLELTQAEVAAKLKVSETTSARDLEQSVEQNFLPAREEAMFRRVTQRIEAAETDPAAMLPKLLPRAHAAAEKTDVVLLLWKTVPRALAIRRVMSFTVPKPEGLPPLLRGAQELVPLAPFAEAARYSGAVEVAKDHDGIVRSVPMFVQYRGRLMPHMTLVSACAMLDVPISKIRIRADSVELPVPDGEPVVIPLRTKQSQLFGSVGMLMDVPWFGGSGSNTWLTMYDYPAHQEPKQHMKLSTVWTIRQTLRDIQKNDDATDEALFAINAAYKGTFEKCAAFIAKPPEQRTAAERVEAVRDTLEQTTPFAEAPAMKNAKPGELNEDDQKFLAGYRLLQVTSQTNKALALRAQARRDQLRKELNGRFALIAWTATGAMDFYPTSLHPTCPGGIIQGVVVNAILTREFWRPTPPWVTVLFTLLVGALTTAAVMSLSGWAAGFLSLLIISGYALFNGLVMFDYGNRLVGAAAPLTAATLIWFGVTVARFIYEQRERFRITKRFSNYVDPLLVNFVVENPERAGFEGQIKEMSVVFTDLAGFTTISEKLQERTVPLLNEYMSLMLPIIRQNRGYWNKFLGDGIMFFYNAPADNPDHARDAIHTVLQMQQAMNGFNQKLFERGLPHVAMRAGISTGLMVVGDAGSNDPAHQASDYTVLGDEVNLGARLESANKALGSRVLMNGRTAELIGGNGTNGDGEFLLRPMGRIQVVGKTEGVDTFEAICLRAEASEKQIKLAEMSVRVVSSFGAAAFDECIRVAKELEDAYGSSKFTQLYLRLSREYQIEPPKDFNGQIVLSEK